VARVEVRDDLSALEGYHSPQVDVAVRLNTNESPFAPPEAFRLALAELTRDIDWNRYPDRGAARLREAIASLHGVDAANVFAANGSNEVLQTLLLTFAGPGRRVVSFEPTYQLHGHIARLTGATVVEVERADDFALDVEAAVSAVTTHQPHVTFLCSPNNPTGLVETPDTVRRLSGVVPGLLVVDEAYGQFADWSADELVNEDGNVVVVRTFSKTWSMAAARLGYLIGPRWLVSELDKVVLPYHLDAFKQAAGVLAVGFRAEMEERVAAVVSERERVSSRLRGLPVRAYPSGANFVLFRPTDRSGHDTWRGLLDLGVLVRDCSGWPRLADCLRVTIGTNDENDAFLRALEEVLT